MFSLGAATNKALFYTFQWAAVDERKTLLRYMHISFVIPTKGPRVASQ